MPAPNPVRELIDREFLDKAPFSRYQDRVQLFDNFLQRPVLDATLDPATVNQAALRLYTGANKDWVIAGTNAADADSALDTDGGVLLSTAGADNDQMILQPAAAINSVAQSQWRALDWAPENGCRFEAIIELPAITALLFQFGLGLTSTLDLTTDNDSVKLQFSTEGATSTTNWTATTSIGGTDVEVDTTRTVEAAKSIRLGIHVNTSRVPRFYVNGVKVHTGGALTAAAAIKPFMGIQALAAAAKSYKVRAVRGSRELNAA